MCPLATITVKVKTEWKRSLTPWPLTTTAMSSVSSRTRCMPSKNETQYNFEFESAKKSPRPSCKKNNKSKLEPVIQKRLSETTLGIMFQLQPNRHRQHQKWEQESDWLNHSDKELTKPPSPSHDFIANLNQLVFVVFFLTTHPHELPLHDRILPSVEDGLLRAKRLHLVLKISWENHKTQLIITTDTSNFNALTFYHLELSHKKTSLSYSLQTSNNIASNNEQIKFQESCYFWQ